MDGLMARKLNTHQHQQQQQQGQGEGQGPGGAKSHRRSVSMPSAGRPEHFHALPRTPSHSHALPRTYFPPLTPRLPPPPPTPFSRPEGLDARRRGHAAGSLVRGQAAVTVTQQRWHRGRREGGRHSDIDAYKTERRRRSGLQGRPLLLRRSMKGRLLMLTAPSSCRRSDSRSADSVDQRQAAADASLPHYV
jgi:hypothetical protein